MKPNETIHNQQMENNWRVQKIPRSQRPKNAPKPLIQNPNLIRYARAGMYKKLKRCLEWHCDVNVRDSLNQTALYAAISNDNVDEFNLLLQYGADIFYKYSSGTTLLHEVGVSGGRRFGQSSANYFINRLIEFGYDINVKNNDGRTALHFAGLWENEVAAKCLLDHGADCNMGDIDLYTPLHLAACYGCVRTANVLLKGGANPNQQSNKKITPLHYAVKCIEAEILGLLLANGANINMQDSYGRTALYMSAMGYKLEKMTKLLLENGADFTIKDNDGISVRKYVMGPIYENFSVKLIKDHIKKITNLLIWAHKYGVGSPLHCDVFPRDMFRLIMDMIFR